MSSVLDDAAAGQGVEPHFQRVVSLPDETVVHPGHGPATTIGRERVSNPYVLDPDALSH